MDAATTAAGACEVSVSERIDSGALPSLLEGADWRRYGTIVHPPTWSGWCAAWRGIAWVRAQAFEREAWAEWEAEDCE